MFENARAAQLEAEDKQAEEPTIADGESRQGISGQLQSESASYPGHQAPAIATESDEILSALGPSAAPSTGMSKTPRIHLYGKQAEVQIKTLEANATASEDLYFTRFHQKLIVVIWELAPALGIDVKTASAALAAPRPQCPGLQSMIVGDDKVCSLPFTLGLLASRSV